MVFSWDNEPIIDIKATPGLIMRSGPFIALNPTWKQKRDETDNSGLTKDAILLSKTFKRSTTILAQALVKIKRVLSLLASTIPIPTVVSAKLTRGLRTALDNLVFDKQMSDIKGYIEK